MHSVAGLICAPGLIKGYIIPWVSRDFVEAMTELAAPHTIFPLAEGEEIRYSLPSKNLDDFVTK